MPEIQRRKHKAVVGDGTTKLIINATPNKLLYALQLRLSHAGGTNTVAGLMTALLKIVVKIGTSTKWELSGTQLRDWLLKRGATYDFNGTPNDAPGVQMTIPFAPEWFIESVQDRLAWNPKTFGFQPVSVELTSSVALNCTVTEFSSDDLSGPSDGIITQEVLIANAAGTSYMVKEPIEPRGYLMGLIVYPDSGASRAITECTLWLGTDSLPYHEEMLAEENDESLERFGLTPAISGRTANVYDIDCVKSDALNRAVNLARWGVAQLNVKATAGAMSGTAAILVTRIENPNAK